MIKGLTGAITRGNTIMGHVVPGGSGVSTEQAEGEVLRCLRDQDAIPVLLEENDRILTDGDGAVLLNDVRCSVCLQEKLMS